MTKNTEISIEIDELVVVSVGRTDTPRPPCPVCAGTAMITPEAAAAIVRVTVRSIYARIEAEGVYFLETPDGLLLLCANSLSQRARSDGLRPHRETVPTDSGREARRDGGAGRDAVSA